jgi:hypothetical protein
LRSNSPKGTPIIVAIINLQADLKSTDLGSLIRIVRLIINPIKATMGEAVWRLIISPSRGMASKASPNPTAERTNVQAKRMKAVRIVRVGDDMDSLFFNK